MVDVLVDGLLQVQLVALNLGHVVADVSQRHRPLLEFQARPPGLDTERGSFSNDLVHK